MAGYLSRGSWLRFSMKSVIVYAVDHTIRTHARVFFGRAQPQNRVKKDMLDTRWLDVLPADDCLAALDIVVEKLDALSTEKVDLERDALQALISIDQHAAPCIAALTEQHCTAPGPVYETDERPWQSVTRYFDALASGYQRLLDAYSAQAADAPDAAELPRVLFNLMDCHRNLAKWRYFSYQPMANGGWRKLHSLYRLAETYGCATTSLSRYPGGPSSSVSACYLESLMLGGLNHTNMRKVEVELVSGWLGSWCASLELCADYDPRRHLFFVNLDEDRPGRRLRNTEPAPGYRYWDLDAVEHQIKQLRQTLQQSVPHLKFPLAMGVSPQEALHLVNHLLGEWSRQDYHRQRRTDERDGVAKLAQVVNGIVNVCQQVKNVSIAHPGRYQPAPVSGIEVSEMPAGGETQTDTALELPGADAEKWHIENESFFGFGALVNADLNLWLRPGRLIALEDQYNPDMTPVGVVRSIRQMDGNQRYVGVQLLSHTPTCVRMRTLAGPGGQPDLLQADIFAEAATAPQSLPPFPALYLPRDDDLGMKASLLMPLPEYLEGGLYELRNGQSLYQVRLGQVVEQHDDWIRVQAAMLEKSAIAGQ